MAWTGLVSSDLRGIYSIPAAPVIISHDLRRAHLTTSIKLETGVLRREFGLDWPGRDRTLDDTAAP